MAKRKQAIWHKKILSQKIKTVEFRKSNNRR